MDGLTFYDQKTLVSRLANLAREGKKEVVFLVGAPLTAPIAHGQPGVANVAAVTLLIREIISQDPDLISDFDDELARSVNPYQTAFMFLQGHRGQDAANSVIKKAVLQALSPRIRDNLLANFDDESSLADLDENLSAWNLSPAVDSLGKLLAAFPSTFGRGIVTSNFDPLIEVSVRKAGGTAWRTVLYSDGDLTQSKATGCQVVHIHGYWHGSDTLHTNVQLIQNRPFLKNSLLQFLNGKTVVVMAYGGWNDVFTSALGSLVNNANIYPEILWCFYSKTPSLSEDLKNLLRPGIDRGRVALFADINCNVAIPELLRRCGPKVFDSNNVQESLSTEQAINEDVPDLKTDDFPSGRAESDRPPSIDTWVGREAELRSLETSSAKVVCICGIGGQGKSVLAAHYLKSVDMKMTGFRRWDWRDCKEERDRFRTQLIACVHRSSPVDYEISQALSLGDEDLIGIFIAASATIPTVYVFDNVDHYVDLDRGIFVGILDTLVRRFSVSKTASRIILTCRPQINYDVTSVISFNLIGMSLEEATELFSKRVHKLDPKDPNISVAHEVTKGHAYWLDLIAIQVGRVPGVTIRKILDDIQRGRSEIPDFLFSIWKTLPEREHVLLRAMAETVRPENEKMLQQITSADLNFKNFHRALRMLVQLNLIVVKPEANAPDLYDLHPIVRQFVRRTFEPAERISFIKVVINQYNLMIKGIEKALGVHLPFAMLERWSQKVELEVEAGFHEQAFKTLHDVEKALIGSGNAEEFVRVARKLFASVDWMDASTNIRNFDSVLSAYIECLDDLEEFADADDVIAKYGSTIPARTARYIGFCKVRAYSEWIRGKFESAIEWATLGVDLKKSSNVDTEYDCEHVLSLATRDIGEAKIALNMFLNGRTVEDILELPMKDSSANASLYGNVGRCLQMMGNHSDALRCLSRSAKILEDDTSAARVSNQAYARQWIGESLAASGNEKAALAFFADAEGLLQSVAPARARHVNRLIGSLPRNLTPLTPFEIRRTVRDWIK